VTAPSRLADALRLAAAGLPTFPCSNDKRPRVRWRESASSDPAVIREWWSRWPDALPAVVMGEPSDLWIADLDVAPDGEPLWERSAQELGIVPAEHPYAIRTRRGGWHLPFRWRADLPGNTAHRLPGVDSRGEGDYVIAWDAERLAAAAADPHLPEPPQTLLDALSPPLPEPPRANGHDRETIPDAYVRAAVDAETRDVASAPEGQRNDTLNRAAFNLGTLVGAHALSRREAEARLMGAAYACGLEHREAEATIRSGLDAGQQHPRRIEPRQHHQHRHREQRQQRQHDQPRDEQDEPQPEEHDQRREEHHDQREEQHDQRRERTDQPHDDQRNHRARDRLGLVRIGEAPILLNQPYLLKGLVAPGDLALLIGPPASGKTTIGPRIIWSVARGEPILGHRTRPAPILWVAAEDHVGTLRRFHALAQELGHAAGIHITTATIDLTGQRPGLPGAKEIAEAADAINAGLVFVDTLAAAFPGLDENAPADMGRAVATLRSLTGPNRACIALHHMPKTGITPRGHGALEGSADLILRVEPPDAQGGPRVLRVQKNRNGPAVAAWPFAIKAVELGTDDEGDVVTAPVADMLPDNPDMSARVRLSAQTALALRYLHDAIIAEGGTLPAAPGFPPAPHPGVPLECWRDACRDRALAAGDEAAQRQAFHRAKTALVTAGHVAIGSAQGITYAWSVRP
jgi:hypothetical protein